MKRSLKAIFSLAFIAMLAVAVPAQIGYSITDNNRDVSGLQQQYYQFDLATGQGTFISNLTLNGQTIRREYEGLASIGSVLYGVTEFDSELCNTGSDPVTGLAGDLRTFRAPATFPLANGTTGPIGPQVGETCFVPGFTESSAAYNPIDGWIYAIAADDTLPANAPRSRLYRISPTTGLATQIGSGATAAGIIKTADSPLGDENPYFDGLAITADGRIFGSENRFNNNAGANGSIYQLFATGANAGRARFITNTLPTDVNRDTGLASLGNTLYLLLEDARVYTITDLVPSTTNVAKAIPAMFPLGNPANSNTLSTPGCLSTGAFCGDFEGFDIPTLPIR